MRKMIFLVIILLSFSRLYAEIETKTIALQAGYDTVMDISIERVAAQGENYLQGMPFNIEDPQVEYVANSKGRLIAYWSLLSNTPFKLTFLLEPLRHENVPISAENEENLLYYILTFEYALSYGTDNQYAMDSEFSLDMNDGNPQVITEDNLGYSTSVAEDGYSSSFSLNLTEGLAESFDSNSFIGNLDGGVYFMFTKASSDALAYDTAAKTFERGSYHAMVTITMEAI